MEKLIPLFLKEEIGLTDVERARLGKMLANNEILNLIKAMGVGIEESFDVAGLRYDRIIIMTDADVDGSHISTLLLTFFFRFMKPVIDGGHVCGVLLVKEEVSRDFRSVGDAGARVGKSAGSAYVLPCRLAGTEIDHPARAVGLVLK